jgi:protein-disulfide isomerase
MATLRKQRPTGAASRRTLLVPAVAAAVVVALLVAASLLRSSDSGLNGSSSTPGEIEALLAGIPQDRAVLGSPAASVTLIQFEDLQCPVCKRYQQNVFPGIVREYVRSGKVKLRFVGMTFIGDDSVKALRYVLAAGAQGKLWHLADTLYAKQGGENDGWVTDELIETLAGQLGLDYAQLRADSSSAAVEQQVTSMEAEASQREIPGTPWFYVQVGDAEPYEVRWSSLELDEFRTILDDALAG